MSLQEQLPAEVIADLTQDSLAVNLSLYANDDDKAEKSSPDDTSKAKKSTGENELFWLCIRETNTLTIYKTNKTDNPAIWAEQRTMDVFSILDYKILIRVWI